MVCYFQLTEYADGLDICTYEIKKIIIRKIKKNLNGHDILELSNWKRGVVVY